MASEDWLMFATGLNFIIIFLNSVKLIHVWDLESDYLNAADCCRKLNYWFRWRLACLILETSCMFLSRGHFLALLAAVPLIIDLVKLKRVQRGDSGVFDPTTIRQSFKLKSAKSEIVIRTFIRSASVFLELYYLTQYLN